MEATTLNIVIFFASTTALGLAIPAIIIGFILFDRLLKLEASIDPSLKFDITKIPAEPLTSYELHYTCIKCNQLMLQTYLMPSSEYSDELRSNTAAELRKTGLCKRCEVMLEEVVSEHQEG